MFKQNIETTRIVTAAPAQVWAVLTDFPQYPFWNPFIQRISGAVAEGGRLDLHIAASPQAKPLRFQPTVLVARPGLELRWLGRFLVPGLFDGEHYFRLVQLPDGNTSLVHGERFRGLLVPLFRHRLLVQTRAGFIAMNDALALRAEAAVA